MAETYNASNIVHGPASVIVDGTNIGYTTGGVTLRSGKELLRVPADQASGDVVIKVTKESMFLTTTMLESTVKNLAMAMGCSSSTGSSGDFGSGSPKLTEHTVSVIGLGPNNATRTFTFYRAVQVEDVEVAIGSRENVNEIVFALELLKDPANDNKFGTFVDNVGT